MPSNAFSSHLLKLLEDAEELEDAHSKLKTGNVGRQHGLGSVNRAAVIMCVSAWEAYVEELVRESLEAIRPAGPAMGVWPSLNATVRGQLGRFNTPNAEQVRLLFSDSIGLSDVRLAWNWRNCPSQRAMERLGEVMTLRHQIAHGVNPRPTIHNYYSSQLPDSFRRLGLCTDEAVRTHLVDGLGIAAPWPMEPMESFPKWSWGTRRRVDRQ